MARFDLKPRKKRPNLAGDRPRRNRMRQETNSTLPYWIAGVVVALIIVAAILIHEWPAIHGTYTAYRSAPAATKARSRNDGPSRSDAKGSRPEIGRG